MAISIVVAFIEGHNGVNVEDLTDAAVIAVILIFNAIFGFVQEFKAEKAIEALKKMTSLKATAIRDGKEKDVDAESLVPGDIILLETGDKVPADCRVLESSELDTLEAALTGESTPVTKRTERLKSNLAVGDQKNCVFSGTSVTKGKGRAVVCFTGMKTEIGHIATMISKAEAGKTPLQEHLARLGKFLTIMTILVSIVVFATGLTKGYFAEGIDFELVKSMLIAAIALAVAAIPEGLPAVVTISLALGVRKMIAKNALIRKLPSVETLGATTIICSDKTGTLTHNQMTVRKIYANNKVIDVGGTGYSPEGHFSDRRNIDMLLEIGALCNDSELVHEGREWKVKGDPTEGCLIVSAKKAGIHVDKIANELKRKDEIAFTSERKRMTTIHSSRKGNKAFMKGAPDIILKLCSKMLVDGRVKSLTQADRKKILGQNEKFANDALRVLGFAYRDIGKKYSKKALEKDFVFVGLQAMIDPPREEVKESISKCKTAGIRVVMITGDHITTAQAIGRELGITGKAVTGAELEKMSERELERQVYKISVYARVDPKHKMMIVKALKKKSEVVAMTGDGVNDAPALKKADIGVAMGITGTDVAKEASDMILTDDNFSSIVNAVEEGRVIYDNIRKFVMYLLSSNIGEVLTIFVGILIGPLPVLALQILWINIATDGLPALALGMEPPEKGIMKRKPRSKTEGIVTRSRLGMMLAIGLIMMFGTLGLFRYYPAASIELSRTIAFTALVLFQLFNVLNLQSEEESFFKTLFLNKWLVGAVIVSLALQFVIIYVPFFNSVFGTVPLSLKDWLAATAVSASILVFGELVKLYSYLKRK
jgi:Ca2+-transporting ATPase